MKRTPQELVEFEEKLKRLAEEEEARRLRDLEDTEND